MLISTFKPNSFKKSEEKALQAQRPIAKLKLPPILLPKTLNGYRSLLFRLKMILIVDLTAEFY